MTLVTGEPRCLVAQGDWCGEGATWSADEGAIYWTDINRFLIHRHHLQDGATRSWVFDEPVVALSLTDDPDCMLVALGSKLIFWKPESDERRDQGFALEGFPEVRFNDGRSDPHGTFWIGSMGNNVGADGEEQELHDGLGRFFSVRAGEDPREWRQGIGIVNTLCWSPDGRRFYTGDTLANEIRAYDVDPDTGDISGERPHFRGFDRGLPDGSAIDVDGYLWNCRYGGGCIVRIAPDGSIDRVIDMPVRNITTCAFAGDDLSTLLVTTASMGRAKGDRLAGSLFAIETNTKGLPENRFRHRK
ncbi:MAG: SMP-30/gluconolactonase/LRE family protein [Geminicoccaceae bacterium]|nr:SMP-30/gluconolactonase/LRE family protein [Geminicoccaceae bacterium]